MARNKLMFGFSYSHEHYGSIMYNLKFSFVINAVSLLDVCISDDYLH